jgi:2',3'-cyclic-nucleotide 2'-phosphodiesterase (5'-nucleotidase family)
MDLKHSFKRIFEEDEMSIPNFRRATTMMVVLVMVFSLFTTAVSAQAPQAPSSPVTFTILHTNDFHGQLQAADLDPTKISTPGMARTAKVINDIRAANTAAGRSTLLVDAGDEMQGSLLSNLGDGTPTGKGKPTIATFNAMNYDVATFGNHEFDWGQENLANRTNEANYPYVTANIVKQDGADCPTSGWTRPDFADAPYVIKAIGTAPNQVKVGFIGVTSGETPTITVATATAGLCFKDPTSSILNYYDQMKADGADVIVVLSHLGYADGGYGYGIPVYGDQTLAANLISAGKPVNLIIGGHSHTSVAAPGTNVTVANKTGSTLVVQSAYNGRRVGQADITVGADGSVSATWKVTVWTQGNATANPIVPSVWRTYTSSTAYTTLNDVSEDAAIAGVINTYATNSDYLTLVNTPVGYSAVDLGRSGTADNMMATFIDDAIYNYLNTDTEPINDVDMFFNNAGGIRTDWCWNGTSWATSGCVAGTHAPGLLNYGHMFTILPFGNVTIVGKMTGAQILEVLNNGARIATSASSPSGTIQPAGLKYKYYAYRDSNPGPQPYAWGAFDYCVVNKVTKVCDPLDMNKIYSVGTNEFLAPAGGDTYGGFKYMTNITYWGDMLNAVNAYVSATYTEASPYMGPNGDGTLDGRITRDGTSAPDSGTIIPITILHHNDSHGNLVKGTYVGYPQLATLIKQERLHNPNRTILLSGGDNIQGDAMSYYFKSSYSGFAADGTPLPDALKTQPLIAAFNSMGYDAMDLGNHEFNFGSDVFKGIMGQANFPILGANVSDDGHYGLAVAQNGEGVKPYIEKALGDINVAILGITNHRVPNYELPSNIIGLTFSNPIAKGKELAPMLKAKGDVVIALTHIGFTTNPKSVEVDDNVDTNFAAQVPGVDAIIGSHSHTNPASPETPYKQLPAYVGGPNNTPVIVNQAYRYNNTLGEVIIGVRKVGNNYVVASSVGQYITVAMTTVEDPATKAIIDPYVAVLNTYNNTVLGQTTTPIDALQAFTQETNAANLQADASVYELAKNGITDVDVHISGAMTNRKVADAATVDAPVTLKVSDMFALMPYENSLVVLSMNGPQLKAVLERGYRNYYYYKYVPGYGGYSYYTTCMLDTNSMGRIYYKDTAPALPDGNNVMGLIINGKPVDFSDETKFYNVSTVNYLAAGSCNFNDGGVSLWPLNQIVHDTQYYVRDATIDYIKYKGTVSPAIEGRLLFGDTVAPVVTINAPVAQNYMHPDFLTLDFSAVDGAGGTTPSLAPVSGVKTIEAKLDGNLVPNGQKIDLYTLSFGAHTLAVTATDYYGNATTEAVTFNVIATVQSLKASVNRFYSEGKIKDAAVYQGLLDKLNTAQRYLDAGNVKAAKNSLNSFINLVNAQTGKKITKDAAALLIADAKYVMANPK